MTKLFKVTDVISEESETISNEQLSDFDFSKCQMTKIQSLRVGESKTFEDGEFTVTNVLRVS